MVSNAYQLVISLLKPFVYLSFPINISNELFCSVVTVLTSPALYHTKSNICEVVIPRDLAGQGLNRPQQAVCHPSLSLGYPKPVFLFPLTLFQGTKNGQRMAQISVWTAKPCFWYSRQPHFSIKRPASPKLAWVLELSFLGVLVNPRSDSCRSASVPPKVWQSAVSMSTCPVQLSLAFCLGFVPYWWDLSGCKMLLLWYDQEDAE